MSNDYRDLVDAIKAHSELDEDGIRQAGVHGADAGWNGFIYTTDGAEFYRNNADLVDGFLQDDADSMGYANVAELVATFARADMTDYRDGHDCLLAWYALEVAGRWLDGIAEEE